ncbi:MAG TPA: hypothetical protein GX707_06280 [Epulopiscium sp.]|nr:hypothetical protein [Candidatus Epulonipiscium sp.]
MELMISQKNQLLEIIKRRELDPFNFEWGKEVGRKEKISCLEYKDTEYLFGVKISEGNFNCLYSPGYNIRYETETQYSWNDTVQCFSKWLTYLAREISQPDLWEQLEKIKEFSDIEYELEDNMQQFTHQEFKQIQAGIEGIKGYLLNVVNNDDEDSKIINGKLDYLIESSERMGKKDWANIFYGTMVSLSISLALDPGQGQAMYQLFKNAVSGIIK